MHTALLLDIGSCHVSAVLLGIETGSLPKLIFVSKNKFINKSEYSMLAAVNHVLKEIFENGIPRLREESFPNFFDHVVISLGHPWSESTLTDVYTKGDDFFESAQIGNKFITSRADKNIVRKLENEIIRTFGTKRGASIQSSQYIFSKVFSYFPEFNNSLIVRFLGDSTEIIETANSNLINISHINIGPNTIVGLLSDKLKLPKELARSKLSLFAKGFLDRDTAVRLDEILSLVEESWINSWKKLSLKSNKVFIFSNEEDSRIAETLVSDVISNRDIVNLNQEKFFLSQIARGEKSCSELNILASFSNMLV